MSDFPEQDSQVESETTIGSIIEGSSPAQPSLMLALAQVAAGGAAVGALTGCALLAGLVVVTPGAPIAGALPAGILFGAPFGAFCGAILAPAVGYWLFRNTPLWRLFTYSAIGTVLGGMMAVAIGTDPITGAFVGLGAGLAVLRVQQSAAR